MSKPRIEMLSVQEALEVAKEVGVHEQIAQLNIFRTLFRRPTTAKALSDLLMSLLFGAELDMRLRELIIMRIGWATGCDYEWTQHWQLALDMFGCTEEELLALRDWRNASSFDDTDRAVLSATDELLEGGTLSDESWARLEGALGTEAAMDAVASVGTWGWVSKVARGLGIPLEEGVASWPPDGQPSPAE